MSKHTLFEVNGTTFRFEQPPESEEGSPIHVQTVAKRAALKRKAEAAKPVKTRYTAPRRPKAPKPGTGEFEPSPGAPGWSVNVEILVGEFDKIGFRMDRTEYRTGCVMFPAPSGCVWLSLWDGQMPVIVDLRRENALATVHMSEIEYERRFGAAEAAA